MHHPLYQALSMILLAKASPISEYELIKLLQKPPFAFFDELALSDSLSMFRVHFLIFHCLYKLRDHLWDTQKGLLTIHTMAIFIDRDIELAAPIVEKDPLRRYYLDVANLTSTTEKDVDALIEGFWEMLAHDVSISPAVLANAESVLQLKKPYTFIDVKRQYRKLQHEMHPDKGGDRLDSQLLSDAYDKIKQHMLINN